MSDGDYITAIERIRLRMLLDQMGEYQRAIDERGLPLQEGGPEIINRLRQAVDLLPPGNNGFWDDLIHWGIQNWAEAFRSGGDAACEPWRLFLIEVDRIVGN
jgi:hypothetical protein